MTEETTVRTVSFNTGWLFGRAPAESSGPGFGDSAFAPVTPPRTVTPLSCRDWDPAGRERAWAGR